MKIIERLLLSPVLFLIIFISSGLTETVCARENFSIQELKIRHKSKNLRVRSKAIYAIIEIGEPAKEAIPDIVRLLKDPNENIRSNALYVLKDMGWAEKVSIYQLVLLLNDPSASVRGNTASVISDIGEPAGSAAPKLIKLLEDPNKNVRATPL